NMASGNASFVWSLRPPEVLTFYGGLYGLWGHRLRRRVDELIEQCELGPHAKTEYNALSTALKQRLALSKALLHDPDVLFLDQPLTEILRWLHEQGVLVRDCQVREPELEEVFVELAR